MKKAYFVLIICSLILFITGLYTYGLFFHFSLPEYGNLNIFNTSLNEHFKNHIFFSIFLGLLPTALYATWKLGKIVDRNKRILSTLIILISIGLAIPIRYYMIHLATRFVGSEMVINTTIVENLRYAQFMLGGLFFGIIVSWMLFRKKTIK
jgi:hypothetical protein